MKNRFEYLIQHNRARALRAVGTVTLVAVGASCASGTSERYSCTGIGGDVKLELVEDMTFPKRVIDVNIIPDQNDFCVDGELSDTEQQQFKG